MTHATQKEPSSLGTDAGGRLVLRRLRVRVTAGPAAGEERVLDAGSLLIGSSAVADLPIDDPKVSRNHLELSLVTAGVRARDLDSTNGTFLGESRITAAVLQPGVELRLGSETRIELSAADVPARIAPSERRSFGPLIGESTAMRRVFTILERVATTDVPLALEGEEGTGKTLAAHAVHQASARREGPFVSLELRADPTPGRVEEAVRAAIGGTLLLEDLDWMPHWLAVDLSGVLARAEAEGLDLRPIVTSRGDLREAVERGTVRRDLFFRLATVRVRIPPLRDRMEDLLPLSRALCRELTGDDIALDAQELAALRSHPFPGNVRELRARIEEARVFRWAAPATPPSEPMVDLRGIAIDEDLAFHEAKERVLGAFEREYVRGLLERHGHNLSRAAEEGGISRNHLTNLAKKHGLR